MKQTSGYLLISIIILITISSCQSKQRAGKEHLSGTFKNTSNLPFDSNLLTSFYKAYPELGKYRKELTEIYRMHNYTHIWYDKDGIVEFGFTLFSKEKELLSEGVSSEFPYQEKVDNVFQHKEKNNLTAVETELMLTNLYLFYTAKVYKGLNDSTTTALGWLLPRKNISYAVLVDSVMNDLQTFNSSDSVLFSQYYKLRIILKKYREIEKQGGWKSIEMTAGIRSLKPGDSSVTILQIKDRLFITGELKLDNNSNYYDQELIDAIKVFKKHNGNIPKAVILPQHIREMNIPVTDLIKKIIVNMERCRWISPDFANEKEYIVVNIPAFRLNYVRNGRVELESAVIVGDSVTKTVIFSGMLSNIVFSPYWKIPLSIIESEVRTGIVKDKNYLKKHNMEWNNGILRQKPGKDNSLGLVKFVFPNTDDIYMHDTPAKSLFSKESRAFSHGCIRIGKPVDLAVAILKDDNEWDRKKIVRAMRSGEEQTYNLKNRIPVYIGYLTAWVDEKGAINFYDDIYGRDEKLLKLLAGNN